jgi:hypothetical protein
MGINIPVDRSSSVDFATISSTQFWHPAHLKIESHPAHAAWPSRIQRDLAMLKFQPWNQCFSLVPRNALVLSARWE